MPHLVPLLLLGAAAVAVLLASIWFKTWGGLAFLAMAVLGVAWYRAQVARSAAAEKFFGDAGEETRLTSLQGNVPEELTGATSPADLPGADGR